MHSKSTTTVAMIGVKTAQILEDGKVNFKDTLIFTVAIARPLLSELIVYHRLLLLGICKN